tara:strand:+ start:1890 stop:3407 length:1518 start_codon:yes stop_codon:yes gene_type:complete
MSFLEETNADAIMEKYNQAAELGQNIPPINSLTKKKIAYNISTGRNDVLLPMEGGGYVVLAELDKDKTQEIKEYAHILKDMPFDIKDYEAAGYTLEEVEAAGVMPKPVEKTGRTEPLTRGEELLITRSGGSLAKPREQTLREKDVQWMVENGEGELRQIYEVLGMNYNEALDLARRIFGNVNSTRGDLGLGIADFTPMGIFYGSEEGINTYLRGRNSGDNVTAAFGALEAGLSLLEAFPVTAAGAKGLKKNIPLLREGLEEFGQTLKQRLNQPGEMPTVGSMGGNIADLKAPTEKKPGIIAFSGSKNDFDEFKLEKVGTGTGAAAFGNGLYFSDLEEIALFYRRTFGSDAKEGKVYQVALDVTPDKLLDYDKPIGQQNQFVQERLRKLVETELNESDAANLGFEPSQLNKAKEEMLEDDMSVFYFLNNWAVFRGKENAAEELLDKYGVKGIKYKANRKDAIGEVSDSDPNNYVIFDDKLISIMKKYGIVAPVAISAQTVANTEKQ